MLLTLKTAVEQPRQSNVMVISERLPPHLLAPCTVHYGYQLRTQDNYYVLDLEIDVLLTVICQRCLQHFAQPYSNQSKTAICKSDEWAEQLMEQYDCVVISREQLNLQELITDELFTSTGENHPNISDCDQEIKHYLRGSERLS